MLNNINTQRMVISVESLAFFRPEKATLERLDGYYTDTVNFIERTVSGLVGAKAAETIDGRTFLQKIKTADPMVINSVVIPFPKELSVDYGTAVQTLMGIHSIPESLLREVLMPFSTWLGEAINKPEKLESLQQYVNVDVNRSKVAKERLSAITKGGSNSTVRYSRAIKRAADWADVIEGINRLTSEINNTSLDAARQKITLVEQMLSEIIKRMNEPRFTYRPSGQFVDRLVTVTYTMAEEIELYAQYHYIVSAIANAVREDVVLLNKKLS